MGSDIQSLAVHAKDRENQILRGPGFASFAIAADHFWSTLFCFSSNSRINPWNINFDVRIWSDGSRASSRVTVIKRWFMRWME